MDLNDGMIQQIMSLYKNKVDVDVFNFDSLVGPHVYQIIPPMVADYLHQYVTNPKNSGDTEKKIKHIDAVLRPYGFKRFSGGTNRVVYKYLENESFVLKVGFDKAGEESNSNEFKNQNLLKPFVNKIFSVTPHGTLATCERVIPIRSRQEFTTIAGDVFDVLANKFVGKYILEDIGTIWFKNWGVRKGFGPVLLDYPYLYEADLNRLYCNDMMPNGLPCGGQIDYDDGFNILFCRKCGKRHKAKQIGKAIADKAIQYKGGSMEDFKIVVMRGDEVIVDKTKVTNFIDPNKVKKQQSSSVTTRIVTSNSWSQDDFDLVMVINGVKMGKKDGKWINLGVSKSKAIQNTNPAIENPYRKVTGNFKKKPKPDTNKEPDWVTRDGEEVIANPVPDKPTRVINIDMSCFESKVKTEDVTEYFGQKSKAQTNNESQSFEVGVERQNAEESTDSKSEGLKHTVEVLDQMENLMEDIMTSDITSISEPDNDIIEDSEETTNDEEIDMNLSFKDMTPAQLSVYIDNIDFDNIDPMELTDLVSLYEKLSKQDIPEDSDDFQKIKLIDELFDNIINNHSHLTFFLPDSLTMTSDEKEENDRKERENIESYHEAERKAIAEHFNFTEEDFERSEDDSPDVSGY